VDDAISRIGTADWWQEICNDEEGDGEKREVMSDEKMVNGLRILGGY
jgi:hypothetical protein